MQKFSSGTVTRDTVFLDQIFKRNKNKQDLNWIFLGLFFFICKWNQNTAL